VKDNLQDKEKKKMFRRIDDFKRKKFYIRGYHKCWITVVYPTTPPIANGDEVVDLTFHLTPDITYKITVNSGKIVTGTLHPNPVIGGITYYKIDGDFRDCPDDLTNIANHGDGDIYCVSCPDQPDEETGHPWSAGGS
jgi:hypothetical protein